MRDDIMTEMGLEALENMAHWAAEAETCFELSEYGGVVEVIRRVRAELDALPLLVTHCARRLPAFEYA